MFCEYNKEVMISIIFRKYCETIKKGKGNAYRNKNVEYA